LPQDIKEKALKFFNMIDVDGSKTIDREETLKFWGKNFPKLNTQELFSQVDRNGDGSIQLDEWLEFWELVLKSGHSKEEVSSEVKFIFKVSLMI
jgi:Ca2+-binding EF-hand superfamily protein